MIMRVDKILVNPKKYSTNSELNNVETENGFRKFYAFLHILIHFSILQFNQNQSNN